MAPVARKPEEIYSHPPPFAPQPPADEPLLLSGRKPDFERIDDNICTPNGLLYLVKFKGAATRCHVRAKYLLDHQDLVDAYWKRDDVPHHERHPWGSKELIEGKKLYDAALAKKAADEKKAANKLKRDEQARKRKEKMLEKQQQALEGNTLDQYSAQVDKRPSSSIDSPSLAPQPLKKARTKSTTAHKPPTKKAKALPKASAVKQPAKGKRKEPSTSGAVEPGPKRSRAAAPAPLSDQDLNSLPLAVGALTMGTARKSGRAQTKTKRFLEGAEQEELLS